MVAFEVEFDSTVDAIFIGVHEGQFAYGKELDENRHVGFDAQGTTLWVSILNASQGVDLDMLPQEQADLVAMELEKHNIRTFA